MCDQQSLRSACAYQCFFLSLEYSMSVKLLTEHHLEFQSLKGACRGSYESTLVKMSNCWKSHATAHISQCTLVQQGLKVYQLKPKTITDTGLYSVAISNMQIINNSQTIFRDVTMKFYDKIRSNRITRGHFYYHCVWFLAQKSNQFLLIGLHYMTKVHLFQTVCSLFSINLIMTKK